MKTIKKSDIEFSVKASVKRGRNVIEVTGVYKSLTACASLGGTSYKSKEYFMQSNEYNLMKSELVISLNKQLQDLTRVDSAESETYSQQIEYYEDQLKKVDFNAEYGANCKFTSEYGSTNWLAINDQSIPAIITALREYLLESEGLSSEGDIYYTEEAKTMAMSLMNALSLDTDEVDHVLLAELCKEWLIKTA